MAGFISELIWSQTVLIPSALVYMSSLTLKPSFLSDILKFFSHTTMEYGIKMPKHDTGKLTHCVFVDWWRPTYGIYIRVPYCGSGFGQLRVPQDCVHVALVSSYPGGCLIHLHSHREKSSQLSQIFISEKVSTKEPDPSALKASGESISYDHNTGINLIPCYLFC